MTGFDEREKAFENKFRHDEELQFKVFARRARLLGEWAAGLMGKSGEEASSYAKEVVSADFEEPGPDDIIRKVHGDLEAKKLDVSLHRVEKEAERLLDVAKQQVMAE